MKPEEFKVFTNLTWKDNSSGQILIGENRGKAAIGFFEKTGDQVAVRIVENQYSKPYLTQKINKLIKEKFESNTGLDIGMLKVPDLYQQNDLLITRHGNEMETLTIGKKYVFSQPVKNFLINGVLECEGQEMQPPITVIFGGTYKDRCKGGSKMSVYSKYIIQHEE